jgi:threonine dehydrogenase-like Zn-dependent dehydrogenase
MAVLVLQAFTSAIPTTSILVRLTGPDMLAATDECIGSLMERGIRFIGNGQAPVHYYWEDLLKRIQSGEIDPLKMVTHRVKVEDLDKVYYKFQKRE